MFTAQKTRKENIAEYILYLWQLEDLLRALQFSPEAIYSQLVQPSGLSESQKQAAFLWYMDIVNLLREEGKEQQGHLEHTLHLIADLNNLHNQLLVLPVGAEYRRLYSRVAPELPKMKARLKDSDISDVELFFRALYSVVLLRIQSAGKHNREAQGGSTTSPVTTSDTDTNSNTDASRKKYIDDVFTAGHGKLYASDGRTRADAAHRYGSGGLLQGKKYMFSITWNAPQEAFTDPEEFFEGKGIEAVLFPFHKANQFIGMSPLPTFMCNDVVKHPHIADDVARYRKHLQQLFGQS